MARSSQRQRGIVIFWEKKKNKEMKYSQGSLPEDQIGRSRKPEERAAEGVLGPTA